MQSKRKMAKLFRFLYDKYLPEIICEDTWTVAVAHTHTLTQENAVT